MSAQSMPPVRRPPRHVVQPAAVSLTAALALCLPGLFSGVPGVMVVAATACTLTMAAVVTGWRSLGSAATAALSIAVVLWLLLGHDRLLVPLLVVSAALLMSVVAALDPLETRLPRQRYDVIARPPLRARLGPPAVALAASATIAVVAAQPVVPSVWLVGVGLLAVVAALGAALRGL